MPIISSDSLETALRHNRIEPLYFLFGEEEFLVEETLNRLVSLTVDVSTSGFNYDVLHGSEVTLEDIVERASAYPFMADRRVVVVKEIDRLFSLRGKPKAETPFGRYMADPPESTILILTAPTGDVLSKGKPKAPYNLILEKGAGVHFKKIYERELPSWTTARIKAGGKNITPEAVELFVGYAGSSLRNLHNEIEKLFTYVESRKQISVDDIRAVVGTSKTYNIFELQKAIGEKNLGHAAEILERMLRSGEPEGLILTMLSRYFTILWRLTELRTRTHDSREMARAVGISPFFINEYTAALGRYSMQDLRNAFEALLHADIILKSTPLASETILQLALISVIRGDAVHLADQGTSMVP